MIYFLYDNTFEGLLTSVFEAFDRKQFPEKLIMENSNIPLFTEVHTILTQTNKAERVLTGLKKRLSGSAIQMLMVCFLSEEETIATTLFNYIRKTFLADKSIEMNFGDPDVLALSKTYRKVQREAEKVRQFVRFQKLADGTFFAPFEPLYNVLPLVSDFFEDRFADQRWIIYDLKRKYGLSYNLEKTEIIHFKQLNTDLENGSLPTELLNTEETDFQELWRSYFKATAIKERINPKLQRQHMPQRFWKYLTEISK